MSQATPDQWTKQDLLEVAKYQKIILWMILVGIATLVITRFIPFVSIVVGLIQMYFIYKLAKAVRSSAAWVYVVLAFFPLIGLLALLLVNGKATKVLRANGVNVGLMGARMTDFDMIQ